LAAVVLYSNIVELLVHTMDAGFYILSMERPHESRSPPVPPERILMLLLVKVVAEAATDFNLVRFHVALPCEPGVPKPHTALWESDGWVMSLGIRVMAIIWPLDIQTCFVQFLRPSPVDGIDVGKMASWLGFGNVLSVGLCV